MAVATQHFVISPPRLPFCDLPTRFAILLLSPPRCPSGFYYCALNRATGEIEGFYFDRSTSPFQKLELRASGSNTGVCGINTATYEFC